MSGSAPALRYKRLLLKLSGEALMGKAGYGIDVDVVHAPVPARSRRPSTPAPRSRVVVGGGNIFRGLAGAAKGMDRATADYMGMLATVMNALALQNGLEQARRAGARALGHPDADGVRILRALQGAAPPGKQAGRDFCRRHRQSILHHRHHGGPAGRRDELRRAGQGAPRSTAFTPPTPRKTPRPCATTG